MPREHDPRVLRLLRLAFADSASNVIEFTRTSLWGVPGVGEGLLNLLPPEMSRFEKEVMLKNAVVAHLDGGGSVTVVRYEGDSDRGDPVTFHEFRLECAGRRLYVKALLRVHRDDEPTVTLISVKLADR